MKNLRKILCSALSLLMLLPVLSACKGTEGASETTTSPTAQVPANALAIIQNGTSDFTIVRPDIAEECETDAAVQLREFIKELTGVTLEITTDYVKRGESYDPKSHEILIGNTNREESAKALENLEYNQYRFYASENKIAIGAMVSATFKEAINVFLTEFPYNADTKMLTVAYNYNHMITCENTSKAYFTGTEIDLRSSNKKYCGASFVTKFFTEGLGRAPESTEYLYYTQKIEAAAFNVAMAASLVKEFLSSEVFTSAGLTEKELCFAVYRTVLTRDPTDAEIASFTAADKDSCIDTLTASSEFSSNISKYNRDNCKWGVNNTKTYTGTNIYTAAEVNQMLQKDQVVSLPQGSLVICNESIIIPSGHTLQTEGNPTHYLKMARLLRTVVDSWSVVQCSTNSTISNIWIDGNRSGIGRGPDSPNCWLNGDNIKVVYNKMSDTIGTSNMPTVCCYNGIYIANNLITCYTSDNADGWTDGITHQANGIIENNAIIDATDVGIVVFRNWAGVQNSIIRNNKIINTGNSCFAALHTDSWFGENKMDFTGCCFYSNELWTSLRVHYNLTLSTASKAWSYNGNDAKGAAFYNNYTPEGLYVVTALGIVSDGMDDVTMRGNQLHVYIAPLVNEAFSTHLVCFNASNFKGDVQLPYDDDVVHNDTVGYINARINITLPGRITLKEGIIFEEFVEIPEKYTSRK